MLQKTVQLHGKHQWSVLSQQIEDEYDPESEGGFRSVVKTFEETREAMVLEGGGLASYFWLDGSKNLLDLDDLTQMVSHLGGMLGSLFEYPGRVLTVRYFRDVTRSRQQFLKNLEAITDKVEALGFKRDFADFLRKREVLSKYFVPQGAILCIETHLSAIDNRVVKSALKENGERIRKSGIPLWALKQGQNPFKIVADMDMTHRGTVASVESVFAHPLINLTLNPLTVDEAVSVLRNQVGIDPVVDPQRPFAVDTRPSPRFIQGGLHVLPSRIAEAVLPEDMENLRGGYVRSGQAIFAPIAVSLGVKDPHNATLAALLNDLRSDIPFSITWRLQGGAMSMANSRKFAATMMKFFNKTANGLIQDAVVDLVDAQLHHHDPVCALQMVIETWAWKDEKDQQTLVARRASTLEGAFRTIWGVQVQKMVADPIQAHLLAQPGFLAAGSIPVLPINLSDALKLMPLGMATSPWSGEDPAKATFWMRSLQRKTMPVAFGDSRVQNSFISLIFGLSGYGKSVLIANAIIAYMLSQKKLPYLAMIDVGYGAMALMELLRHYLKDTDRILGFDLHKQGKTINPFDTQLGYRYPLNSQKEFLINLLVMIVRRPGVEEEDMVDEVAEAVIGAVYRYRADEPNSRPHLYVPGKDRRIDEALQGEPVDNRTRWWDVVDLLFRKKEIDLAASAQRFAMPTLSDVITVINEDPAIASQFGNVMHPRLGMRILDRVALSVSQAVDRWPMLAGHSDFSIGKASMVAINLEHVVRDRSDTGKKQAGIMYLMARFLLTKDFLFHPLDAQSAPDLYRRYHEIRAERILTTPKLGVYDELHNTNGLPAITNQIEKDAREWRKNNGILMLASQMPDDFSKTLANIATSIYILTNPFGDEDNPLLEKFSLSKKEASIIKKYCVGGAEGGSGVYCMWRTKTGGDFRQLAFNVAPPAELWAYTTTPKDRALQRYLTPQLGLEDTLDLLSVRYPGGSAVKEIADVKGIENEKDIQQMMQEEAASGGIDPDVKTVGDRLVAIWKEFVAQRILQERKQAG
ncbi:hypothetical protein [Acidithiobacillus caldus]|jgi:intracellular multiplication protein IcmB|uniref:IcmB (DotO) protein n=1 Tax=Acidithiobacillus caldus (strain ATCC 51756 / DSM 8584 / KU) TaxID=637389 RepID=A0A059ZZI4_ACICK|nr:hypothetical protein [Acidithiobacillus caldus]AIA55426.1 IcmB (DotO) protein [Acidithiobacillus caldus ATCC 51756]MBU2728585.1 type IV secretion protein IcmB [Acidithiobacillus caldus]MBU2736016.1 type IV secretion protein IcmB [Acidithiobacillus caldus ATCC 51756]MBU2746280.1 type IV secretion protein IcmB [Acidithiobacillus caldus]MBU2779150.1 type IV secretion protein IcmB [Acidithiobacillus caldus]